MSILRVGSNSQYAENYDHIFGKKKKASPKTAKKKVVSTAKTAKKKTKKKTAKKKAKR